MKRKIEILAPAGSLKSLRAAICAGADAVYIGGMRFGARAYAKNLSKEELLDAIDYVHIHGRRIYLTVNTLLKNPELDQLYEYLYPYYQRGIDGVIVQDTGVIEYLRTYFPLLPIHASTQMTITGADGADFLKEKGVTRVVPSRELSLSEIRQMKEQTGLEIECFVHGALCYCYSGQCLLSSMIGGRSGNRGQCAQPCRLPYSVEGKKAADLMSLKDLCTIDMLPELLEAGIDSFKIEGRMKQPDYVYTVVRIYRKYADLCLDGGTGHYQVSKDDKSMLLGAYQRRGYTEGYYKRHNGKGMISLKRPSVMEKEAAEQDFKIKEKINGNLILSPARRAKLVLSYGEYRAECEGETAKPAIRQPLGALRVEKQMRKTGETEFEFGQFQVSIDGDVFLPMQALNDLRRRGILELTENILKGYRRSKAEDFGMLREEASKKTEKVCGKVSEKTEKVCGEAAKEQAVSLTFSVQSLEQLKVAVDCEYADAIYVDDALCISMGHAADSSGPVSRGAPKGHGLLGSAVRLLKKRRQGCKVYLAMPYIFRSREAMNWEELYGGIESLFDGVLIRNWESYWWLKKHGFAKEIRSDHNLYVFNRYGKTFMEDAKISRYTAPLELSAKELEELDIRGAALSVYGYQPVMVTANCILKTTGRCRREDGFLYLQDRYQKRFAVRRCCRYCYNIIYNSAPLFLADKAKEIRRLAPKEVRLDFTTETAKETAQIMGLYIDAFPGHRDVIPPKTEYTRGHFKRGVK